MPDHVKQILNRAYLEDNPYNDIVLHLGREMRLNGLEAPDEATLIPLNTVDAVTTEDEKQQQQQQRGYCFHCGKYGHYKAQCCRLRNERYYATKTHNVDRNKTDVHKPKCDPCGKMHKNENGWDGANAANDPRKKNREFTILTNKIREQPVPTSSSPPKKLKSPRLRFVEKVDARAYPIEDPPNRNEEDLMTECNKESTQDWQRRWNVGMILRHNA